MRRENYIPDQLVPRGGVLSMTTYAKLFCFCWAPGGFLSFDKAFVLLFNVCVVSCCERDWAGMSDDRKMCYEKVRSTWAICHWERRRREIRPIYQGSNYRFRSIISLHTDTANTQIGGSERKKQRKCLHLAKCAISHLQMKRKRECMKR